MGRRVAIVSESFLPTLNGVTTSVQKLLEYLSDRGDQAMLVVPTAGSPHHYAGFPVHEVPAFAYRQFPVGLPNSQVTRLLQEFRPDVLHVASPFLLGAQALAAAKRIGIPSVAVYQTDVAGYARRNRLTVASGFAWRVLRWIHDGADLTLAPSSSAMADLIEAGVPRLARWGRGVDVDRFHPSRKGSDAVRRLREELSPDGLPILGYVGRIAPEKSLERLSELGALDRYRLVVVGGGPAMPAVRRALDGLPAAYLGELSGDALADAYASLDVFVHTGLQETFGQTLQEAHASGLPVIAPRAGGPVDLVEPGVDGMLYDPELDGALARAVRPLLDDAGLRARMGEAGRRRVAGRSWPALLDELMRHYDQVMAAAAPGRLGQPQQRGIRARG